MAFSGGNARSPFTISQGQPTATPPPAGSASTGQFSFGGGLGGSTGFNFGGVQPQPAAAPSVSAPQLSFTAPTPVASAPPPLFNFGGGGATNVAPVAAAPAQPPSFQFGQGMGTVAPQPPATASVVPTMDKSFGAAGFQSAFSAGSGGAPPANTSLPSAPVSFSAAPPPTIASSVQPTFGAPAPTTLQTAAAPGTALGGATTMASAAPQGGFSFGTGAVAGTLNLTSTPIKPTSAVGAPAAPPQTTQVAGVPPPATATQVPTTTSTAAQPPPTNVSQINFRQLQEIINKWNLDLQEEEKVFVEQATKVNAWDRTLIANGDKIAKLNDSISKVKTDHGRLEHALEYIKTQQQEFESFLEPLEAGLPLNIPVEPEREQLYTLTDSVDTQLQQMSEDLKEVIRHINEANKSVDKNDPVSQILRILNEHMDALHWVEDNTNQIKRSMEDVSKQHQTAKKDHERSLRMMFK